MNGDGADAPMGGDSERDEGAPGDEGLGEESGEGRPMKGLKAPREPSASEVEEHNRTHWPRRPWCRHCAGASSVALAHRSSDHQHGKPVISVDYCYVGAAKEDLEKMEAAARARAEPALRQSQKPYTPQC